MSRLALPLALLVTALPSACLLDTAGTWPDGPPDAQPDADAGADADGDTDSDADVDADADSDGDTDTDSDIDDDGEADLDPDVDDDPDVDADPDDDSDLPPGTIFGEVDGPCAEERGDVYQYWVEAGAFRAVADTVDSETTTDLRLLLSLEPPPDFLVWLQGDDEVACTYPPPCEWSCPEIVGTVSSPGMRYLFVGRTNARCCADPYRARYSLSVTLDGEPLDLTLLSNDVQVR